MSKLMRYSIDIGHARNGQPVHRGIQVEPMGVSDRLAGQIELLDLAHGYLS